MQSSSTSSKRSIRRFRCWNRKGYAIFNSLSREVLIGRMKKKITDCSLCKLRHLPRLTYVNPFAIGQLREQDWDDGPGGVLALLADEMQLLQSAKSCVQPAASHRRSKENLLNSFYNTLPFGHWLQGDIIRI